MSIAIPKGRLLGALLPVLEQAGLPTRSIADAGRRLILTEPAANVRFLLLKPDDVPTYVEHGTCDLGIVGRDVLLERGHDVAVPLDLGIGKCRIVVAGPQAGPRTWAQPRVASKYLHVAEDYFASIGQPVQLIPLSGSVEIAASSGLADLVVDIVESGETLRQNRLHELVTIVEVSAVVIVNRTALKLKRDRITPLLGGLARARQGTLGRPDVAARTLVSSADPGRLVRPRVPSASSGD